MSKYINLSPYGFYEWGSKELNFCLLKDSGWKDNIFICVQFGHMSKNELILPKFAFLAASLVQAILPFWFLSSSFAGLCSAIPGHPALPCPTSSSQQSLSSWSDCPLTHFDASGSSFTLSVPEDEAYFHSPPLLYSVSISPLFPRSSVNIHWLHLISLPFDSNLHFLSPRSHCLASFIGKVGTCILCLYLLTLTRFQWGSG